MATIVPSYEITMTSVTLPTGNRGSQNLVLLEGNSLERGYVSCPARDGQYGTIPREDMGKLREIFGEESVTPRILERGESVFAKELLENQEHVSQQFRDGALKSLISIK